MALAMIYPEPAKGGRGCYCGQPFSATTLEANSSGEISGMGALPDQS